MITVPLYVRCAVANRFTLLGYAIIVACVTLVLASPDENYRTLGYILFWSGFGILGSTSYGFETLRAYRRVMQSADRFGRADERVVSSYGMYCGKTGARLAQKDLARSANKARME